MSPDWTIKPVTLVAALAAGVAMWTGIIALVLRIF